MKTELNINFAENFNNKLDKFRFTTIRKYTDDDMKFYEENKGKIFKIFLNRELYCEAKLYNVRWEYFNEIPAEFIIEDTGMTYANALDFFAACGITSVDQSYYDISEYDISGWYMSDVKKVIILYFEKIYFNI